MTGNCIVVLKHGCRDIQAFVNIMLSEMSTFRCLHLWSNPSDKDISGFLLYMIWNSNITIATQMFRAPCCEVRRSNVYNDNNDDSDDDGGGNKRWLLY